MITWLSARSAWLQVPVLWAVTLTAALAGVAVDRTFLEHPPLEPLASSLPMAAGGSFLLAVACAGGLRKKQQRH
ncbi:hypothetical protein [Streptomyces sp. NPDC026659]|uniref:hypothetical protein n=1 Tax=Streptomyces sp. NPDC026659 TaxID=3155123 RepID=UPI0033E75DF4